MAEIVAADDDPDMQTVVKTVLDRAGHAVTICDDGSALVDTVRAQHPDVVVTDNEMPLMTGLDAVQVLREDPETADIPVVLAAGSVSAAEAAEVLVDGDQLVHKPFTARRLNEAVGAAARHRAATHHD